MSMFINTAKLESLMISIRHYIRLLKDFILTNKSLCILMLTILLIYKIDMYSGLAMGCSLYIMTLLRELLNHKINIDTINQVDLHYFETANKNLEDPLDGYIDLCIQEYMLLYRGYKAQQYITEKEEANIRKEVLDIIASTMSDLMRKKFELYYGTNRLPAILARKCFIKISLMIADNNKVLYQDSTRESEINDLMKRIMVA